MLINYSAVREGFELRRDFFKNQWIKIW